MSSTHIAIPAESGQVYVTGPNTNGQLSLGTTTQTNTFTFAKLDASTNMTSILQVADGSAHTLFLKSTGQVYSAGLNTNGQLGLGTTVDSSFGTLVQQSAGVDLSNVIAIAAGGLHSVFVTSDGSALACGLNTSGQLGDLSSNTQKTYPSAILTAAGTKLADAVSSVSAGDSHTLLATSTGTAWSCGSNVKGQLGVGNVVVSTGGPLASQIDSVPKALWLSNDTAFMTMDGLNRVSQWSDRSGNGRHATQSTDANKPVYDATTKSIVLNGTSQGFLVDLTFLANTDHMAFILTKPTNYANIYGAPNSSGGADSTFLHIGFSNSSSYRFNYYGNDNYIGRTSNFILNDFNLLAFRWLAGTSKTVFANTSQEGISTNPVAGTITGISGGGAIGLNIVNQGYYGGSITEIIFLVGANMTTQNINIVNDYMMKKINDNYRAVSGFGFAVQPTSNYALQVKTNASTNLTGISQLSAGGSHSLAVTTTNTVYAWGANSQGQLALGTNVDASYATLCLSAPATTLSNIVSVAAGEAHSLFLTRDGTVFACGSNSAGQLSDGTTTSRSYPVQVLAAANRPLTDILSIYASANQSYFLSHDGTVYAAGFNGTGGFGNGTTTSSSFAIQVMQATATYMKSVGFSSDYIKRKGATAANLQTAGFSTLEIFTAGYTKTELTAAGYTIAQLRTAGITYNQMIKAGYTNAELIAAGYPSFTVVPTAVDYGLPVTVAPVPLTISTSAQRLLWLDATDATTITTVGSNVTQWRDKFANGRHMTVKSGSGATQTTINSINILDFTNLTEMQNTAFVMPTSYTIFAVGYTTVTGGDGYARLLAGITDFYLFFGKATAGYATFVGNGTGWNDSAANSPSQSVSTLKMLGVTNSNAANGLIPYVNGTAQNAKNGTTSTFTGLCVGGGFTGQTWRGYIGEVIIYDSVLSSTDRVIVENYLKSKWGIA